MLKKLKNFQQEYNMNSDWNIAISKIRKSIRNWAIRGATGRVRMILNKNKLKFILKSKYK